MRCYAPVQAAGRAYVRASMNGVPFAANAEGDGGVPYTLYGDPPAPHLRGSPLAAFSFS